MNSLPSLGIYSSLAGHDRLLRHWTGIEWLPYSLEWLSVGFFTDDLNQITQMLEWRFSLCAQLRFLYHLPNLLTDHVGQGRKHWSVLVKALLLELFSYNRPY
ncbi:hypothetical protein MTO96_003311 [Rhipicephalus appendiculatus]